MLGCGSALLRLVIETLEAGSQYDYLVVQVLCLPQPSCWPPTESCVAEHPTYLNSPYVSFVLAYPVSSTLRFISSSSTPLAFISTLRVLAAPRAQQRRLEQHSSASPLTPSERIKAQVSRTTNSSSAPLFTHIPHTSSHITFPNMSHHNSTNTNQFHRQLTRASAGWQATDNSVPFYEHFGFIRVGAVARYRDDAAATKNPGSAPALVSAVVVVKHASARIRTRFMMHDSAKKRPFP